MSYFKELYTWINAQVWAPDTIAFDVKSATQSVPYYNMLPSGDDGSEAGFCNTDSGQTVIQFNGYGYEKYALYDTMDTLRQNVKKARNSLSTYTLWDVNCTGVIGFGTEDAHIYRFMFEMETHWTL